jgi:RHS repeat-associated protein
VVLGRESSTGTGAKYATTTDYVFGDSLVATVDQQTASGNATGTAKTRYIHPDHLGSTNVVTDENDAVVQTLDYYPYGSTRISVGTSTNEKRKYIGQFTDDSTLSYLQARYYDSGRGQFLSEDPIFTGDPKAQSLPDPQSLNAYSYAEGNPITKSDPSGKFAPALAPFAYGFGDLGLASTVEFWGPPVAIGAGVAGTAAIIYNAYHNSGAGAPGSYQAYQEVSGQGYNTDPNIPPRPPKGPWGTLAWTSVITAVGIGVFNDYFGPVLQPDNGLQPLRWPGGTNPIFTGNGPIFALPPIVIQGSSTYYRNSSGLLSTAPQQGSSSQQAHGSGSGGSSSLPATVSQGGVTYYRNSSGLLSTSPGK